MSTHIMQARVLARPLLRFTHTAHFRAMPPMTSRYQSRAFSLAGRDTFDDIDDRDVLSRPVHERGLTKEEFDALPEDERAAIIAAEEHSVEDLEEMEQQRYLSADENEDGIDDNDSEDDFKLPFEDDPVSEFDDVDPLLVDPSIKAQRDELRDSQIRRLPSVDYTGIVAVKKIERAAPINKEEDDAPLAPWLERAGRSTKQMVEDAIAKGPAVHQSSFIDNETPLTPHWLNMQTQNPEFIPPLPGADYNNPLTVKYPFIPVIASTTELKSSSVLHRLLQFNRLDSTKHFLKLERLRRQLAYERQHRDLRSLCEKLVARLPKERVDLKDAKPTVKNLPTNMQSSLLEELHPHSIPTTTDWMAPLLWTAHDALAANSKMSQREKEKILMATHRTVSWTYRRMMKDKEAGYYRIMATPPMHDVEGEGASAKPAVRPAIRSASSTLRASTIVQRQSKAAT